MTKVVCGRCSRRLCQQLPHRESRRIPTNVLVSAGNSTSGLDNTYFIAHVVLVSLTFAELVVDLFSLSLSLSPSLPFYPSGAFHFPPARPSPLDLAPKVARDFYLWWSISEILWVCWEAHVLSKLLLLACGYAGGFSRPVELQPQEHCTRSFQDHFGKCSTESLRKAVL